MKKIMFSLLVHEQPSVILDQIINVKKFNPNSMIVIHINPKFNDEEGFSLSDLLKILDNFDYVYINENRLKVGKDDIIQAHVSNFEYVKNIDFDYFYFIASNELFLKEGAEAFVEDYDFGCEKLKYDDWFYIEKMKKDQYLEKIYDQINSKEYYYSQIEGSFYSKEIMGKVMEIIDSNFDYKNQEQIYPRDEVFFSTIANNLFENKKRYDGCLCKIRWEGKILFTSLRSVKKIIKNKYEKIYFSVKRVDRKINDYLRSYIRDYKIKYFDENYKDIVGIIKQNIIKIHILNCYYLVIYFIRDKMAKTYRFIKRIFKKK